MSGLSAMRDNEAGLHLLSYESGERVRIAYVEQGKDWVLVSEHCNQSSRLSSSRTLVSSASLSDLVDYVVENMSSWLKVNGVSVMMWVFPSAERIDYLLGQHPVLNIWDKISGAGWLEWDQFCPG